MIAKSPAYYRDKYLDDVGLSETAIEENENRGEHGLAVCMRQSRSKIIKLFVELSYITASWLAYKESGGVDG